MMKKLICILCVALWATGVFAQDVERVHAVSKTHLKQSADVVSLAGEWRFRLDPDDAGMKDEWYNGTFTESINLPGSLQEQGYGNEVDVHTQWTGQVVDRSWYDAPEYEKYRQPGNIKVPFWLNPEKHYVGVAWYQREINIPKHRTENCVLLELERTHWETALFTDGNRVGNLNSLSTPHRYELKGLKPGKHTLTLRVDNRVNIPVGINAHSVSDHTQSNWNGVIGNISLSLKPAIHISDVQIYPDVANRQAEVRVTLGGKGKVGDRLTLQLETMTGEPVSVDVGADTSFILNLSAGENLALWSEHHPNLYRLKTVLQTGDRTDVRQTAFGFREFKREGTRFHINGQPTFLRGTLECCIFPLTGYPAMDKSYWEKIYGACKAFGLNHVRFHSWCPPEAAFAVADSMGIYLQIYPSTLINIYFQDRYKMI